MRQGEYPLPFPDRREAGTLLGKRLTRAMALGDWAERAVVLALPRGGVAVAKQVAAVLDVPMNVIVTRKIGYPPQPELGVGAIAEGLEEAVYDASLLARLSLTPAGLAPVVAAHMEGHAAEERIAALAEARGVGLSPQMNITEAMQIFDATQNEELAVIDEAGGVLGLLAEVYVARRYARELERAQEDLFGET